MPISVEELKKREKDVTKKGTLGGYGETAIKAVGFYQNKQADTLRCAWDKAAKETFHSCSSQSKGCPRSAFLGLCQEGLIEGVPSGKYTVSTKNREYALKAVELLRKKPEFAKNPKNLWKEALEGEHKAYNQQMHVVIALWDAGFIRE
ncbi:MAG: hypothetical protein KAT70_03075 [Thermoplasmata archaeon]|nr:hypothetical protein [Thermoplasmata archaeon]